MRIIKIILLFLANIFTSYWLVRGLQDPEVIGFIKSPTGQIIQPDTFVLQMAGFLLLFFVHACIILYLGFKVKW